MKNKLRFGLWDLLLFVIGLIPLIFAATYYSQLPSSIAIHFNVNGGGNGFIKKEYALLVIGLFSIGIPILFKITRQIDPKRFNYIKFESTFELFRLAITILLSSLLIFAIAYNLGYTQSFNFWGILIFGVFLIFIGNSLSRIRYNYFIGIRTPWTLANEEVWRRTHRFSGFIFILSGILLLISLFINEHLWVALPAVIILAVVPIAYSYVISRKIKSQ